MQKMAAGQANYQSVVGSLLAAHQAMLDAWYNTWELQQKSRLAEHLAAKNEAETAANAASMNEKASAA